MIIDKLLISPLTSSLAPSPRHRRKLGPSRCARCHGFPWRPVWPSAFQSGCSGSHTTGKSPVKQKLNTFNCWADTNHHHGANHTILQCISKLNLTHISQIQDETVSLVEAFPVDRHLCCPDNATTLHLEHPLNKHLIGDNMLEPRCHTPFLEKWHYCHFIHICLWQ